MKAAIYIFVFLFILNSVAPYFLYSQCCDGEESTLPLTGNSGEDDKCTGECSPVIQCGDCLAWFLTADILMPSQSSELKTFSTLFINGIIIRISLKIFQPPKV
jgi:hypothetical protein